ncbi:MAG: MBL fold metallo-hydrolase, partial [Asticcacaulis sp.]|nr:MBL fold metallo-hydrolase [Asticcacaulis sp.]
MKYAVFAALLFAAPVLAETPAPPMPQVVSDGVWLIPGGFPEGRQPDGNTIVFRGTTGLIVMDTGRHPWHTQAIIDFAKAQNLPVTALVNSHWHLDHTSGNRAIKDLWPEAKLYTSTAVIDWSRDHFTKGIASSQAFLDSGQAPPDLAEDVRLDIETRKHPEALLPDVPVTQSQVTV